MDVSVLETAIADFIREYQNREDIGSVWGEPLVGYADAWHPYIQSLRDLISPTHGMPQDVMEDASIIVAYFVPFTKELSRTNRRKDHLASPEWARTYEETNAMFGELNQFIVGFLTERSYHAAVSSRAGTFDQKKLISDWSQRHIAYAAGLGTFGMNNMLITRKGCCGRYSTVVTNLDVTPGNPLEEELCLYRKNGTCGVCMRNCPAQALTPDGYDRNRCYEICKENAAVYTMFGSSYLTEDGSSANSIGSEVCGKCITRSPCAFW